MLPDQLRLLVSAYAAGELSPRRKLAAERLLHHSEEARTLLSELQRNSRRLRALPRLSAPVDFAAAVLERIPDSRSSKRFNLPSGMRWRNLLTVTAAAAVMMAICSSAWMVIHSRQGAVTTLSSPLPQPPAVDLALENRKPPTPVASPRDVEINSPATPAPSTPTVVSETPAKPMPPTPNKPPDPVPALASPPTRPFEPPPIVLPRLPIVLDMKNLDRGDGKEQLTAEFDAGSPVRIDLFARDTYRATEKLSNALRRRGVHPLIDPSVDSKRRQKGPYLIYCDDLNSHEWHQLLRDVGVADRGAESKRPGDGILDELVAMPVVPNDQRELEKALGVDPLVGNGRLKPASTERKPSSSKAEAPRKTAVVTFRSVSPSFKEVRSHFENRHDRAAGGVPVMLVIRPSN
jgi:hypothetical protein